MRVLTVGVIAALSLAACGGGASGQDATSGTTAATGTAPTAPAATTPRTATGAVTGPAVFAAPAVGGGTIDTARYAGAPIAFWFWAPY